MQKLQIENNVSPDNHVYVAFLRRNEKNNGIGEWMHQCYTRGDVKHVQVCFYKSRANNGRGTFYTFTADAVKGEVYLIENKQWTRRGWEFYAIPLRKDTCQKMQDKATELLGRPYNFFTIFDYMCIPMVPDREEAMSCAHMTTAILQAGGLFKDLDARLVTDVALKKYLLGLECLKYNVKIENGRVHSIKENAFQRKLSEFTDSEFHVLSR